MSVVTNGFTEAILYQVGEPRFIATMAEDQKSFFVESKMTTIERFDVMHCDEAVVFFTRLREELHRRSVKADWKSQNAPDGAGVYYGWGRPISSISDGGVI
jgi:hypothetical protein